MSYPIYTQDQVNQDLGTNDPVRTTEDTQGTSSDTSSSAMPYTSDTSDNSLASQPLFATGDDDGNPLPPTASTQPGAGAPSEDAGTRTVATAELSINSSNQLNSQVTPQPNALDKFASYTYSLSWYMITPEQAKGLKAVQKINTNQWSLLMQSGGATSTQTGVAQGLTTSSASTGRNKYFALDYYMDNLIIETSFNNVAMSSVNKISFTVTEPNGITLLQNLAHAVRDMYKDTKVTAKDAIYIMAIKFYGYDAMGNQLTLSSSGGTGAAVTKYFPFKIANFDFKAASRAVEYMIEGMPLNDIIGKSSALGSIPENYQLVGETVDDLLNGKAPTNTTAAESNDRGSQNKTAPNEGSSSNASATASYNKDGSVDATDANAYGEG